MTHKPALIPAERIMQSDAAHARLPHSAAFDAGAAFSGGKFVPVQDATVPLLDMGFRNSDATYDVVSVSRGSYFRLQDHLDRIDRSCERFRLRNPYHREETVGILNELMRLTGLRDAYVWWAITRGVQRPGVHPRNPSDFENRLYAFAIPYRFIAGDAIRKRGLDMMISRAYIRIPSEAVDARAKNFHWMDLRQSLFEAADTGHEIPVLCDAHQRLTEAPGANIFVIKGTQLMTPARDCLEGITRRTVLELADDAGLSATVGDVRADDLREADEAFVTSTAGGVMPVTRVDGRFFGDGTPGPYTTRLHNLYWEKRWAGWHASPVDYAGSLALPSR